MAGKKTEAIGDGDDDSDSESFLDCFQTSNEIGNISNKIPPPQNYPVHVQDVAVPRAVMKKMFGDELMNFFDPPGEEQESKAHESGEILEGEYLYAVTQIYNHLNKHNLSDEINVGSKNWLMGMLEKNVPKNIRKCLRKCLEKLGVDMSIWF